MYRLRILGFSTLLSYSCLLWADTLWSTQPENIWARHGFSFSGHIEPSYNYLSRSNHFTSGAHARVFDLEPQGFTLQQAAVTLAKQPVQGWGAVLNVILGRDANTLALAGINPDYFGIQNLGLTPTQAYLQYAFGAFKIVGGLFNCPMGAETYNPTVDSNFSRSLLDGFAEPTNFIGLQGSYTVNAAWRVSADINNGWGTIQYTGRPKTIEVSAAYTPHPDASFTLTGISGIEPLRDRASSGPTGRRTALDGAGSMKVTERLTVVLNYDYGLQTKAALAQGQTGPAYWQGLAAYANYQWADRWRSSLRGEVFTDRRGSRTGVWQTLKEVTLTLAYVPLKKLQLRVEARHDFSNVKSFVTRNGASANNNQQSFALEGLYQF